MPTCYKITPRNGHPNIFVSEGHMEGNPSPENGMYHEEMRDVWSKLADQAPGKAIIIIEDPKGDPRLMVYNKSNTVPNGQPVFKREDVHMDSDGFYRMACSGKGGRFEGVEGKSIEDFCQKLIEANAKKLNISIQAAPEVKFGAQPSDNGKESSKESEMRNKLEALRAQHGDKRAERALDKGQTNTSGPKP